MCLSEMQQRVDERFGSTSKASLGVFHKRYRSAIDRATTVNLVTLEHEDSDGIRSHQPQKVLLTGRTTGATYFSRLARRDYDLAGSLCAK